MKSELSSVKVGTSGSRQLGSLVIVILSPGASLSPAIIVQTHPSGSMRRMVTTASGPGGSQVPTCARVTIVATTGAGST